MTDHFADELRYAALDLGLTLEEFDARPDGNFGAVLAAARRVAAWRRVDPQDYEADKEFRDAGLYEEGECLGRAEY